MRWLRMLTIALMLPACPRVFGAASDRARDTVRLVVLHINDEHGHLLPHREAGELQGGVARVAMLIERVRKEAGGQNVLLLHAGDVLSRGDSITTFFGGCVNFEIMNRIGFDAFTPGNGEFYTGVSHLLELQRLVRFPFIEANLASAIDNRLIFEPSIIKTIDGIRIAIIGLGFIHREHPSSHGLALDDPMSVASRLLPDLHAKADCVIALTHIGYPDDERLAAIPNAPDIIVGGHSHDALDTGVVVLHDADSGRTLIAQAGEYDEYLGRIDAALVNDGARYRIVSMHARLISVDSTAPEDAPVARLLRKESSRLRAAVCTAHGDIPRTLGKSHPLDTAVARALKAAARADVALVPAHAIGGDLRKGPVLYADICRIYPAGNRVVDTAVAGSRLYSLLGVKNAVLDGVLIDTAARRIVAVNGRRFDPGRKYRVAIVETPADTAAALRTDAARISADDVRRAIVKAIRDPHSGCGCAR